MSKKPDKRQRTKKEQYKKSGAASFLTYAKKSRNSTGHLHLERAIKQFEYLMGRCLFLLLQSEFSSTLSSIADLTNTVVRF